ncbi:MAG: preprotein translocase subunit SecG [Candidatus Omnitrophica bacterium]|nr:preprotein translocase subunit SecG [Candidatus Omnitrophota bacterium]MDD5488127.1 preprotein translocase subunit SecG [Candidatus Omnitrophota bacterium]
MFILLVIVHVIVCIVLIATILLQAGRGGGLTEALGGGEMAQSILGTQAPEMLKKATEVCAILFIITSLALGMVTARSGKSLFDTARVDRTVMPVSTEVPAGDDSAGQKAQEAATEVVTTVQEQSGGYEEGMPAESNVEVK